MTDRELLTLAAKAAGIGIKRFRLDDTLMSNVLTTELNAWNPLTDDGDALRLAVKLNMHIHVDHDREPKRCTAYMDGADSREKDGDPYAATRRAIVRAAAEIGKDMK